ncbi:MAG: hypothetical protein ORN51_07995, partial [Akkermansiaceae bacterium]|nr:hypothetical protein [Akkermansiaceae bacterium]
MIRPRFFDGLFAFAFFTFGCFSVVLGAVPQILSHQGRIAVGGTNFDGNGQFKFSLVNSNGSVTYWSNDGSGTAGAQPTNAVSLPVTKGLYSVMLGDTGLTNMQALAPSVFENQDVRLRVWFNDGSHGFQLITPDQRLGAAPYALAGASAGNFTGSLAGDVTGTQSSTSISSSTVTGKILTNFASGAGNITATDTILSAINKLDGNVGLKANSASPTFSGTVTAPAFSGPLAGNVTGNVSGSAGSFTGNLSGDVTGTQSATAISAATVTGKAITGYVSGSGNITATDTVLTAINKLNGNDALKAPLASPAFTGTVTAPAFSGAFTGNVSGSAGSFTGNLSGDVTGAQSATSISATTVTGKAITGYVSGSGNITATDTVLTAINKLNGNDALKAPLASPTFTGTVTAPAFMGNLTGNISGSAANFTGNLSGDVTGPQSTTVISPATVTGKSLTGFISGAGNITATDTILSAINKLDGNSGLKANSASPTFTGTVTAPAFMGNVTGNISGSAANFTGNLSGDVTGPQSATAISPATVTGKVLTGYVSGSGNITAGDTVLTAINKLNGNDALKAPLASPTFTGTVTAPAFMGNVTGNISGSAA